MGKILNALPTFIIIGTIKSGTSGLYRTMIKHSKIKGARNNKKELVYLQSKRYQKNLQNYRQYFFPCKEGEITGEATPSYILYEKVAQRLKFSLPNIKLIVLLRNPVIRAYSQYYHAVRNVNRGIYPKIVSFDELIEKELQGKTPYPKHMGKHLIKRGIYVTQLEMWYKYFSKNQIMIIKSEEYFNNPQKILKEVYKFVGVPYEYVEVYNPEKRIYPKSMNPQIQQKLKKYFVQYNERLYQLIERDMEWENEI